MDLQLSWFDLYYIYGGLFWWITLPLGLAALGAAAISRRRRSWSIFPWAPLSVLLLGGPVVYAYETLSTMIGPPIKTYIARRAFERHTWVLEQPTMVAGLNLPQGTVVQLSTRTDVSKPRATLTIADINEIVLPRPMKVFGVELGSTIKTDHMCFWIATLPRAEVVQGRPCAEGTISFYYNGLFQGCSSSVDGKLITSDEIVPLP